MVIGIVVNVLEDERHKEQLEKDKKSGKVNLETLHQQLNSIQQELQRRK